MNCSFPDCSRPSVKKTLCSGHYAQLRKGQELKPLDEVRAARRRKYAPTCSVEGCGKAHMAFGYCELHGEHAKKGTLGEEQRCDPNSVVLHGAVAEIEMRNVHLPLRVDVADLPLIAGEGRWFCSDAGYATRKRDGRREFAHTLIMQPGKGLEVDHESGDRLDCRRSNMRIVTHGQNMQNRGVRVDSQTQVRGVQFEADKGLYRAKAMYEGQMYFAGRHKTLEAADAAVSALRESLMTHTREEDRKTLRAPVLPSKK